MQSEIVPGDEVFSVGGEGISLLEGVVVVDSVVTVMMVSVVLIDSGGGNI